MVSLESQSKMSTMSREVYAHHLLIDQGAAMRRFRKRQRSISDKTIDSELKIPEWSDEMDNQHSITYIKKLREEYKGPRHFFLPEENKTHIQLSTSISMCAQADQGMSTNTNHVQEALGSILKVAAATEHIVHVQGSNDKTFNEGNFQILHITPSGQDVSYQNNVDFTAVLRFVCYIPDEGWGRYAFQEEGTPLPSKANGPRKKHGSIKRPMNAFMLFGRAYRPGMVQMFPKVPNTQISTYLGNMWHSMTSEQQKPFYEEAKRIQHRHQHDYPECPDEMDNQRSIKYIKKLGEEYKGPRKIFHHEEDKTHIRLSTAISMCAQAGQGVPANTNCSQEAIEVADATKSIVSLHGNNGDKFSEGDFQISHATLSGQDVMTQNNVDITSTIFPSKSNGLRNKHGTIKRPMNAFMLFGRAYRPGMVQMFPKVPNTQISTYLGNMWHSMTSEQQKPFYEEAKRIQHRHQHDYPEWSDEMENQQSIKYIKKLREEYKGPRKIYLHGEDKTHIRLSMAISMCAQVDQGALTNTDCVQEGRDLMPEVAAASESIVQGQERNRKTFNEGDFQILHATLSQEDSAHQNNVDFSGTNFPSKSNGPREKHGIIKRPMNAFILFSRAYRPGMVQMFPKVANTQISTYLGNMWHSMTSEQQKPFYEEAKRIRYRHQHDYPEWSNELDNHRSIKYIKKLGEEYKGPRKIFLHGEDKTHIQLSTAISMHAQANQGMSTNMNGVQEAQDLIPEVITATKSIVNLQGNNGEAFNKGDFQILHATSQRQDVTHKNYVDFNSTPLPSKSNGSRNKHGIIKRPMNAFMLFGRAYRPGMVQMFPKVPNNKISTYLGNMWHSMTSEQQKPFYEEAKRNQYRYEHDCPGVVASAFP